MFGAVYAQALPAIALLTGRNRSRGAILVAGVFLFSLGTDLFGRFVGHRTGNSLWVSLLSGACITSLFLLTFGEWQRTSVERLAFRIAVVPFLAIYGVLVFLVDGIDGFSRFAYPFGVLVTLGGALWTLLRRTTTAYPDPVARTDWFLLLLGVALNAATTLITSPVAAVLMARQRVDLITQVWEWRAGFVLLSIVLVSLGARRPAAP